MQKNLLKAEFVSVSYRNAKIKISMLTGHESAHKGVAQELFLHECLPPIIFSDSDRT
jgi:hypothetical protein